MKELDCEHCDSSIIKSYGVEVKMRSKLVKWTDKGMFAVCKSCGHENQIKPDIMKSMQASFVFEVDEKLENREK